MRSAAIFLLFISLAACGGAATENKNRAIANTNTNVTASASASAVQTVTVEAPDGVKLVGSFFAASKLNSPALLLLHQWESSRHSYDDFARRMQASGFGILSIDGRGFGDSTLKADGTAVTPGRTEADVKAMLGDVDAAFSFLGKQQNVDAKRVGIVGASYGSSLAIIYAADHPDVAAVALLSPGLNYFGNMQIKPAIVKYGQKRPLMFLAGTDDSDSANAASALMKMAANDSPWSFEAFDGGGHGAVLFKSGADKRLEKFFIDKMAGESK
jgi:dienelactone hydrolase